jgi:hypothetical protein
MAFRPALRRLPSCANGKRFAKLSKASIHRRWRLPRRTEAHPSAAVCQTSQPKVFGRRLLRHADAGEGAQQAVQSIGICLDSFRPGNRRYVPRLQVHRRCRGAQPRKAYGCVNTPLPSARARYSSSHCRCRNWRDEAGCLIRRFILARLGNPRLRHADRPFPTPQSGQRKTSCSRCSLPLPRFRPPHDGKPLQVPRMRLIAP